MDNPLIQVDPGLFIWTILTFLVLLGLLGKFAWKPLLAALDSRHELIKKSLDDADKAKQELERLQQDSREIISEARVEAQSIVAKSRSEAEKLKGEMKQKAKEEAGSIVRSAEKQIQVETEKAIAEIRGEVVDLSLLVASRLVKKNLSKEDNQSLIEESRINWTTASRAFMNPVGIGRSCFKYFCVDQVMTKNRNAATSQSIKTCLVTEKLMPSKVGSSKMG